MKEPELVSKLFVLCEAWLIGGAVDDDNPKDWDVWVPLSKWSIACGIIPKEVKVNRFGGFKINENGIEIDVWTSEFQEVIRSHKFTKAYCPFTGVKIIKE